MKSGLRHAAIVIVLTLVSVECTLQLAGIVGRPLLARGIDRDDGIPAVRVLCVGDSHTFGAPLPRDQSYPSQLQKALDERGDSPGYEVINLGVPGVNSAFVANRLEAQILQFRPNLVIVWAGANNLWNAIETEAWGATDTWGRIRRALLRLKLFRFAMAEWARRNSPRHQPLKEWSEGESFQLDSETATMPCWWNRNKTCVAYEQRDQNLSWSDAGRGMTFDMERMVSTARSYDVPIVFISYPVYFGINEYIASTAERLGVPHIAAARDMQRALDDGFETDDLIVQAMGPHPKATLYRYVVETLMSEVDELRAPTSARG